MLLCSRCSSNSTACGPRLRKPRHSRHRPRPTLRKPRHSRRLLRRLLPTLARQASCCSGEPSGIPAQPPVVVAIKEALLQSDGRTAGCARARCYLLDVELPRHLVVGAHLFKHEWSDLAKMLLGIDSVDDARNGLLLYKPLEWAFATGRLMVVLESGQFVVRLLDPGIREVSLHAKAVQLTHKSEADQATLLATLTRDVPLPDARSTFGALHDARAGRMRL